MTFFLSLRRLQNRESAVRSRQKKRDEIEILEAMVRELNQQQEEVERKNAAVAAENEALKKQNEYFKTIVEQQAKPQVHTAVPSQKSMSVLSAVSDMTAEFSE